MKDYKVCSFFGHSEIKITEELRERLGSLIENMIVKENFGVFFFGGFGMFDELAWEIVTELKNKYKI